MTVTTTRRLRPIVEEILEAHLVEPATVVPGALVTVRPDHVYVQDGNAPTVRRLYEQHGFDRVFDPKRVSFVFDHSVLVANTEMANRMKEAEQFARTLGIDVQARGRGISHVIATELGWWRPGALVLGSDSHTCVGGAFGALGLGVGASDITAAMVTGKIWLRVPDTVVLRIVGRPHPGTRARDVMMTVLQRLGQDPFLYRSVEVEGEFVRALSDDAAASMASLSVELGAKCIFLPRPAVSDSRPADGLPTIEVDIEGLRPVISLPHLPANLAQLGDVAGTKVDYAFVGSCTNSRLEDIAEVAGVVKGRRVHPHTQLIVTPGSLPIYRAAMAAGYVDAIVEAGGLVTPPGCGACVGTQGPLPADGDVVLSTMNRNFRGRMGNPEAIIHLASPLVTATAALLGAIPSVEQLP
jgi:3-isopropylmalate/(R)-2-methylmalate dehydratase large subunit